MSNRNWFAKGALRWHTPVVVTLRFPDEDAVGTLDWIGAPPGPNLARGVVDVPDGVAVSLEVMPIERVAREGAQAWSVHPAPGPLALDFLQALPTDVIDSLSLRSAVVASTLDALPHLAPGLTHLYLVWTDFTDDVLPFVAQLTRLTYLQTFGNRFTDAGVQQLASLTRLESLYLEEGSLGYEAFEFAEQLPRLKRLGLQDVELSRRDLTRLRDRLPGVDV